MTPDKTPADRLALLCSPEDVAGSSLYNLKAEMFEIAQASDASDYDFCDLFDWVKKLGQDIMEAIAVIKAKDKELADYRASKVEDDELQALLEELHNHQFQYEQDAKKIGKKPTYYWSYGKMEKAIAALTRLQSQSANPWVEIDDPKIELIKNFAGPVLVAFDEPFFGKITKEWGQGFWDEEDGVWRFGEVRKRYLE